MKIFRIITAALVFTLATAISGIAQATPVETPQAIPKVTPAQPNVSVEALPITCATPEQANKAIGNAFDTMLLQGKSSVSGFATAILFNRHTGEYAIVILLNDGRICFVDYGKGSSGVLKDYI